MKRIYRNILAATFMGLSLCSLNGCNAWMDIYPENQQTSDNFWQSKEEVQQVLMGTYSQLRKNSRKLIQWGDLRGDLLKIGATIDANEQKIKNLEIISDNAIAKWDDFYKVIGRANSVIKYSDQVLDRDVTFTQELSNSYTAEAVFLRSLCYFYLVRTFGEVPLVLEPYVDDTEGYDVPKSSEETILEQLVTDLKTYAPKCKYSYEKEWEQSGRVTRWAYYTLLADICLWKGDYEDAITFCNAVLEPNGQAKACQFTMINAEEWYTIFYPGNSSESIFELQWSNAYDQKNDFFKWFFNGTDKSNYLVSTSARALFEDEALPDHEDVRGPNASYLVDNTYDSKVWKFAGTDIYGLGGSIRGSSEYDANFVIYRLSDVVLMKAEALVMQGKYADAVTIINDFRAFRGHAGKLNTPDIEKDALLMVVDERSREFIAEGKRWFDILRVAKRNNYQYQDYVTDALLLGVDARDYQLWKSRLSDRNSFYMPVHKDEVDNSNGVVTQNSYYNNQY